MLTYFKHLGTTENKMSDQIDRSKLQQIQQKSIKALIQGLPQYQVRTGIHQYEKQLVETRTMIYHKQTKRLLSNEELKDPEARKAFVITRVARELWTNFCVRGQDTPMLRHLQKELCKAFNANLHFLYIPGSIELVITKDVDDKTVNVSRDEHLAVVSKAWDICQQVVASYIA